MVARVPPAEADSGIIGTVMSTESSFKHVKPTNRLRGDLPKVGIRPTIDGRYGGVRESLEPVTMAMAQTTAQLISKSLKHSGKRSRGMRRSSPRTFDSW